MCFLCFSYNHVITQPIRSAGGRERRGLAGSVEDTFIKLWGVCVCVHMSHPSPGSGRVQDCVGREQRASVAQEASFLFSHRAGFPKPLLSSLDFSLDFFPPFLDFSSRYKGLRI